MHRVPKGCSLSWVLGGATTVKNLNLTNCSLTSDCSNSPLLPTPPPPHNQRWTAEAEAKLQNLW